MKFLADECVDSEIVTSLRENGFDISYIAEFKRGADDESVLSIANKEVRILITADKDFGELVFRLKKLHKGVVLYRLSGLTNSEKSSVMGDVFTRYCDKFENNFALIDKRTVRIKSLI